MEASSSNDGFPRRHGAYRFAGKAQPWYHKCYGWLTACCFPREQEAFSQEFQKLLLRRQVSLGRPTYTDLSKLHQVGSFNLKNFLITQDGKESGSACLLDMPTYELKTALRQGLRPFQRPCTWPRLVCGRKLKKSSQYSELLYDVFYGKIPREVSKEVDVPDFGGALMFSSHPITADAREEVRQLLCVIKHHRRGTLTYCPMLPDLCAIIMHYVTPDVAFLMIDCMIKRALVDSWHFTISGVDFQHEVLNFLDLLPRHLPQLSRHLKKIGFSLEDTIKVWFGRFFVSFFAYDTIIRIVDIYLNEGSKTLFRVALSVLKIHEIDLMKQGTPEELSHCLARNMAINTNTDHLLKIAFTFKVPRSRLKAQCDDRILRNIPVAMVEVFHVPRFDQTKHSAITTAQCRKLWTFLPPLLRIMDPRLLYATYRDGYSLKTALQVFRREQKCNRPTIIIIKDEKLNAFGAVLDWRAGCVAGNDTFLFSLSESRGVCYKAKRLHSSRGIGSLPPPLKLGRKHPKKRPKIDLDASDSKLVVPDVEDTPAAIQLRRIYPEGKARLRLSKIELVDILSKGEDSSSTERFYKSAHQYKSIEPPVRRKRTSTCGSSSPVFSHQPDTIGNSPVFDGSPCYLPLDRTGDSMAFATRGWGAKYGLNTGPHSRQDSNISQSLSYQTFDAFKSRKKKNLRDNLRQFKTVLSREVGSEALPRAHTGNSSREFSPSLNSPATQWLIQARNWMPNKRPDAIPRLQITEDHLILSCAGRIAIALNSDFSVGFTHRTQWWGNPPLTKVSSDGSFVVQHVEIYGFNGC